MPLAETIAIVNPSRRRRARKSGAKRRRSPAQVAAFKRMIAARRNPSRRRVHHRRRNPVTINANPRRRRRHASARRYRNPSRVTFRAVTAKPMSVLGPALTGAIGAIAVNTIIGKLPLPATMLTGRVRYLTQGAFAIGLAMLASRMGVKAVTAGRMAEGALTVTLNDAIKDVAAGFGMSLGQMGYYLPSPQVAGPARGASPAQLSGMNLYLTGPGARNVVPMRSPGGMSGMACGPQFGGARR